MKTQNELIWNLDWDVLIVLDACRYDLFKEVYPKYLKGKLQKVETPGHQTVLWRARTWTKKIDSLYFSANPNIRSKRWIDKVGDFCSDKFSKVYDLWDYAWDRKLSTVPPWNVNKEIKKEIKPDEKKKIIVHYMQPHGPWIGETMLSVPFLKESEGDDPACWTLIQRFTNEQKKIIPKAHKDNLELVLVFVRDLCEYFKDKKIIVTADHGELLGEGGKYLHHYNILPENLYRVLIEIPWFEVDTSEFPEKVGLTKRLEKLGYLEETK